MENITPHDPLFNNYLQTVAVRRSLYIIIYLFLQKLQIHEIKAVLKITELYRGSISRGSDGRLLITGSQVIYNSTYTTSVCP